MCLMVRKQLSHGIKTRKNNEKSTYYVQIHVSVVCSCTFWYGTTHGPAHGPAGQIHRPAHIEPVLHGPRCHVVGRPGPGRDV